MLGIQRAYPGYFRNPILVSVAVIDSGSFKGKEALDALEAEVQRTLERYQDPAQRLGGNSDYRMATGTDVVDEATRLWLSLADELPRIVFFAGKLGCKRERRYERILHHETAHQIQRRLERKGQAMTVLPIRVARPAP